MYKKIDLFYVENSKEFGKYLCSTNMSKTCREAKEKYLKRNPKLDPKKLKAYFSKN